MGKYNRICLVEGEVQSGCAVCICYLRVTRFVSTIINTYTLGLEEGQIVACFIAEYETHSTKHIHPD